MKLDLVKKNTLQIVLLVLTYMENYWYTATE